MIAQRGEAEELRAALDAAVTELKALGAKGRPRPSRYHVRELLLPLGLLLVSGEEFGKDDLAARVDEITRPFAEKWREAVTEELQLASAEFVTSVDERYLALPSYDFDYTTAARERLEARLLACDFLGYEVPAGMVERIADADERYAPYRDRAAGS